MAGGCSPEEAHEVLVWINSEEGEVEFKEYSEQFLTESAQVDSSITGNMRKSLHTHMIERNLVEEVQSLQVEPEIRMTSSFGYRKMISIAASIIFVLSAVFFILLLSEEKNQVAEKVAMPTEQVKSTDAGQKLLIHLSDGSTAYLNSNSSITYPKEFAADMRSVAIKGEVFFDVTKDKTKPFVVITDHFETKVLGTTFNVNASGNGDEYVSLVTGKVEVKIRSTGQKEFLVPGEELALETGSIDKHSFNIEAKTAWRNGTLYFDNVDLEQCFKRLESWYDVEIQITNPVAKSNFKVSGKFQNDNLTNVLNSIGFTHNFNYNLNGKQVLVTFKTQ